MKTKLSPQKGPKNIAVFGAGSSVVNRFLAPTFPAIAPLYPDVRFIPLSRNHQNKDLSGFLLPSAAKAWINTNDFLSQLSATTSNTLILEGQTFSVDGAILAVPTAVHYQLAKICAQKNIPVWIEKPLCLPGEIAAITDLQAKFPDLIFAVDFFMDSPAFIFALRHLDKFLPQIGQIKKIEGRLIENWPLEPGREWLLDRSINGGGLGMDVLVHLLALISSLIDKLKIDHQIRVTKAKKFQYRDILGNPPPGSEETYMWIQFFVNNLPICIDGGKGTAGHYYGLSLIGDTGSLEIFTGTDGAQAQDPYVKLSASGKADQKWLFPHGGIGYSGIFREFLQLIYHHRPNKSTYSLFDRFQATLFALKVMQQAYEIADRSPTIYPLGTTPPVPSPITLAPTLPLRK